MRTLSLALLPLFLVACGWEEDVEWTVETWSDDAQSVAVVEQNVERLSNLIVTGTGTWTRHIDTRIHVATVPNGSFSPVGPALPGRAEHVFLMGSEGYAILGRTLDEGDDDEDRATWIYTRLDLATGQSEEIDRVESVPAALFCQPGTQNSIGAAPGLNLIPSPDASVIAVIESTSTCDEVAGTVSFFDAADLSPIGTEGSFAVDLDVTPPIWAWSETGEFMVSNGHAFSMTSSATAFSPSAPPELIEDVSIDCFHPMTVSSSVNSDGEYLNVSDDSGFTVSPGGGPTFGCE